ncbi:AAA family ATPase [Aminivibrio sp.]|uniref:AAA family ATPase n=1 Tax=Aminivibrio sp. TaxID=1872489 RepID=UPI001A38F3ED|nr:AAA family ATPase [Aminivibrio sp.]MBL3539727.1 ATP-binding protein [Aminivibrio sp.]
MKNFSERIRLYLEGLKERERLFPIIQKTKEPIRDVLNSSIFHGASLSRSATAGQKEVRLNVDGDEKRAISYMTWSTGQREFLPMLLGCYELLPGGKVTKRKEIEWVVIEEPEMGLHPMGTFAVMVLILDILSRGYKVAVTTHSSNVLDIVWAIEAIKRQEINEDRKIELISRLLDLPGSNKGICDMIGHVLRLEFRTHSFYYQKGRVQAKDISSLDPGDEDEIVAGWGGLAAYSGRVSDLVAEAVSAVILKRATVEFCHPEAGFFGRRIWILRDEGSRPCCHPDGCSIARSRSRSTLNEVEGASPKGEDHGPAVILRSEATKNLGLRAEGSRPCCHPEGCFTARRIWV